MLTIEPSDVLGEARFAFNHVHQTMDLDPRTAHALMARYRYDDRTETYMYKPGKTLITIERQGKAAEVTTEVRDAEVEEAIAHQAAEALRLKAKKDTATSTLAGQPCTVEVVRFAMDGAEHETHVWVPTDALLSHALGNLQLLEYRLDGKQAVLVRGQRMMNVRISQVAR